MKPPMFIASRAPARQGFALVLTLLILCLLIIVVVSYLSGMSIELQTADAYTAKVRAAQAAQAAVDGATSILAESFRDFPDSATVWDTQQSFNYVDPSKPVPPTLVNSSYNEGTSLYLRAVPSAQDSTAYAVPLPTPGPSYTNGGTSYAANDPKGNTPNNPACKNFVVPLISGMPLGHARLPSARAQYYSSKPTLTNYDTSFPPPMNLNESDPTKQNWADLNVRRASGDIQGAIGSPPNWSTSPPPPKGPKPARAYWVNLKGSSGLITGRYAFWIDDESFRLNTSVAGGPTAAFPSATPPTQRPDNSVEPLDLTTGKPRSLQPGDLTLVGTLAGAGDTSGKAPAIMATRANYPGYFFSDPLAFSHTFDGTTGQTSLIDTVRYLTTNQSGALNVSRHGSQRLNLTNTIFTPPSNLSPSDMQKAIQKQVNQLVETLEFHLPNFGERFYRTSSTALNDATQVPGSPYPLPVNTNPYATGTDGTPVTDGSNSQIYYYKVAANLRDYADADCQPTMIGASPMGVVMMGAPTADLGEFSPPGPQANPIWAQGKECTPYIQEVAVRYRPSITYTAGAATGRFSIGVDYYIEFWNMSDRDISASQMGTPSVWVRDQQTWDTYYNGDVLQGDPATPLVNNYIPASMDLQINLTGVVFHAGAVTVITTDPDYQSYVYTERTASAGRYGKTNNPSGTLNSANVILCPLYSGSRLYTGVIAPHNPAAATPHSVGVQPGMPFEGSATSPANYPTTGIEVSLVNSQGYVDVVRGAITMTGECGYHLYTVGTDTDTTQGGYKDYSYGSSMMGNVQDAGGGPVAGNEAATVSQLGDPRTTNEQLKINVLASTTADGTRFVASSRTLGTLNYIIPASGSNYPGLQPDTTTTGEGWPDYYKFPSGAARPSPDATTAPVVIAGASTADGLLTSVGQLGDIFDPARVPGADINYSHGGGRTFKIGQHDDLYSDDATTNVPTTSGNSPINTADNVSASTGWASWRLADVFDVADPIQLPGRININGITRDNGAALLSALQGFIFQPKTATSGTAIDANIHGDGTSGLATAPLDTTGTSNGFSQIVAQMKQRLDPTLAPNNKVKPFFERGELSELGVSSGNPLFGTNATATNNALVSSVDMNKTADHSREELFRRMAELICTRGNTFTAYVVGQSVIQTTVGGPLKITGTQQMRVTFQLMPKIKDPNTGTFIDFHPAYVVNADGTFSQNTFDPANPSETSSNTTKPMPIGVIPRFAKPDRYDVQILQAMSY